jgi:hypothetical protein
MKQEEETTEHEPEVIARDRSLELRRPSIPTDINELANLEENRGKEIIEHRAAILENLRIASIKLTVPRDWTLFKNREGVVTGFLGDEGCDRVKKLWGIQIDGLSQPERIPPTGTASDGAFAWAMRGDGHCKITGESVYDMEGVRYSNERYAEEKPDGIQREVAVKKAARANLDGGIARELMGMKSVPIEELDNAWKGGWKNSSLCNKGRGFGSADERAGSGASSAHGIDPQDIPECDVCRIPLVWRAGKGDKEGFFGCRNWEKHKDTKVIVQLSKAKELAEKKKATAAAAQTREPGAEG